MPVIPSCTKGGQAINQFQWILVEELGGYELFNELHSRSKDTRRQNFTTFRLSSYDDVTVTQTWLGKLATL